MLALMGEAETNAFDGEAYAKTLPGIRDNAEFWDPMRYCSQRGITEGKIKFYREVELKHGRLGMLAALGIVVGENYHPLFGGDIDAPAYLAFQQTPLQTFWPVVVLAIAIPEIFSVLTFNNPGKRTPEQRAIDMNPMWTIRNDHIPGNLLGLSESKAAELKELQTKELNNGRLAMIAIAGMVVQEGVTGGKLSRSWAQSLSTCLLLQTG